MAKAKEFPEFDPAAMDALIGKTKTPSPIRTERRSRRVDTRSGISNLGVAQVAGDVSPGPRRQ